MIIDVLSAIQSELKAPKGQTNKFGGYKYRSCEDILEAVKPLLKKHNAALTLCDDVVSVGDRIYVKATATLKSGSEETQTTAFAREAETKKGMDDSQITGTASSYARKYALNGLFAIDDTKDADSNENRAERETRAKAEVVSYATDEEIEVMMTIAANKGAETFETVKDWVGKNNRKITKTNYAKMLNKLNAKKDEE